MTILYDLETDGLLHEMTKIHLIGARARGKILRFHDAPDVGPRDGTVREGVEFLNTATTRAAHNGLGFDEPALSMMFPDLPFHGEVRDTMVMAALAWPAGHLRRLDATNFKGKTPAPTPGAHSLQAWGIRLGAEKLDSFANGDFSTFTPEMLTYGVRDVEILGLLWDHLLARGNLTEQSIDLEHRFAAILRKQELAGIAVDPERMEALVGDLVERREELDVELQRLFPPKTVVSYTPKKRLRREKVVPFNPGSRDHIAERLLALGWTPLAHTQTGKPRVAEEDLKSAATRGFEGSLLLLEHFLVSKRLASIQFGDKAWAKFLDKPQIFRPGGEIPGPHRLHGRIRHNGTVTHRCAHSNPNLGQVPGPAKDPIWGARCREVFVSRGPGWALVGTDAANLELRGLAHYLGRFDGGAYTEMVMAGDMHSAGMTATGMTNRGVYKERFYALLYGAGDPKLGKIVGKGKASGRAFRESIMRGIAGFGDLVEDLGRIFDGDKKKGIKPRHWLTTLDGRRVYVRTKSAILNSLLQSFGAIVMKQATVNLHDLALEAGYVLGRDYEQVAHVHDEIQLEVPEELVSLFSELSVRAIRMVTDQFNLRCPLDGEAKTGGHWGETH